MREVARLGFVLLGIQIALSSVQSAAHFLSDFDPQRGSVAFAAAPVGAILVLVFIPGCVLAARSRAFATYLFPNQDAPPSEFDLVAAGLAVLGAYLFIVGFSGALSYTAVAAMSAEIPAVAWTGLRSLVWSVLEAALGFVLFRYPQRILRRLGGQCAA